MTREILIAIGAIALFAGLFWAFDRWSMARDHRKRLADREYRRSLEQVRADMRRVYGQPDLSQPIPWSDDGLDVSKLEVRHEPTGE